MFNSISGFLGFIAGVGLTIGLLLSPHLIPGGLGYGKGLFFSPVQTILLLLVYGIILAATLFFAGKLFNGAAGWKEPKVISGTVLIAFIANALYVSLVELFALKSGMRALIAVAGVPVIYGNLSAVLGKTSIKDAMLSLFAGALATMGAGFIIVSLIKSW